MAGEGTYIVSHLFCRLPNVVDDSDNDDHDDKKDRSVIHSYGRMGELRCGGGWSCGSGIKQLECLLYINSPMVPGK